MFTVNGCDCRDTFLIKLKCAAGQLRKETRSSHGSSRFSRIETGANGFEKRRKVFFSCAPSFRVVGRGVFRNVAGRWKWGRFLCRRGFRMVEREGLKGTYRVGAVRHWVEVFSFSAGRIWAPAARPGFSPINQQVPAGPGALPPEKQ